MSAQVIQLNEAIIASTELLRQILGERVTLSTSLTPHLVPIQVDPNQLRAALIGVAARARNAMPQGGRFVIETRKVVVTEHHSEIRRVEQVQMSLTHGGTPTPGADWSSAYASLLETGGRITAETDDGRGTIITFCFPCGEPPATRRAAAL